MSLMMRFMKFLNTDFLKKYLSTERIFVIAINFWDEMAPKQRSPLQRLAIF